MVEEILKILIVEDDNERIETFTRRFPENFRAVVVQNGGSALGLLERDRGYVYAGICLDYDLLQQNKTAADWDLSGENVVRLITWYISPKIPILIHSMNRKRAPIMVDILQAASFDVTRIPMCDLNEVALICWLEEVQETWEDNHES